MPAEATDLGGGTEGSDPVVFEGSVVRHATNRPE